VPWLPPALHSKDNAPQNHAKVALHASSRHGSVTGGEVAKLIRSQQTASNGERASLLAKLEVEISRVPREFRAQKGHCKLEVTRSHSLNVIGENRRDFATIEDPGVLNTRVTRLQVSDELLGGGAFESEETKRIRVVDRVPTRVPIQIEPARQSNRVFLRKKALATVDRIQTRPVAIIAMTSDPRSSLASKDGSGAIARATLADVQRQLDGCTRNAANADLPMNRPRLPFPSARSVLNCIEGRGHHGSGDPLTKRLRNQGQT